MPIIRSKRELEGYVMIDHRESPGFTAQEAFNNRAPPVGAGEMFESSTITCSHCQCIVIINPQRTRERGYCRKCDHYVCDLCELERVRTGVCKPFKQVIDEFRERALKGA